MWVDSRIGTDKEHEVQAEFLAGLMVDVESDSEAADVEIGGGGGGGGVAHAGMPPSTLDGGEGGKGKSKGKDAGVIGEGG